MDKLEKIPTDRQAAQVAQLQKREWVTPAFEQVALKQALNSPPGIPSADGTTFSS